MSLMTNPIVGGITDIKRDIKMGKKKVLKLIDLLYEQLQNSGNFERVVRDEFSDGSGAWIDCYHTLSPNANGKRYNNHLSFNGDGTVLEDVQVWVEEMTWDDDKCKQLR
jgi:hypothetical protein